MRQKSREAPITIAFVLSALAGVLAVGVIILVMVGVIGTGPSVHEPTSGTATAPRPSPAGTTGQSTGR